MRWPAALLSALMLLPLAWAEQEVADKQQELEQLGKEIQQRQSRLVQAQVDKDKQLKSLRQAEKAVSDSAVSLRRSEQALQQSERKLGELEQRRGELEAAQAEQQAHLASQLRTAWMSGEQDHTALLLGSDEPATLERMMVYYQYLNQARIDAIEDLQQTQQALEEVTTAQRQERDRQQQLHQQQLANRKQLQQRQQARQQALSELEQRLSRDRRQLDQLEENRDVLEAAISQALEALAQSQHHHGLSDQKGVLPWPLPARLSAGFGSRRQGQLTWNGWLLSAPSGREVKAISNGQVVFADWLRGFGLVVVVDHGDEYLSLYGHAQALLKQVGEQVEAGEVVALSGDSGGLEKPGLYFEIRHRGRAVDPKGYLAKS
ncbi:murein hydrolase activator EnvC family protein [Ferrimonas marina]|uniref:Septal ring factor EnvC, activator of murein hydrolases AmiA and AmiB n=1 Tax=Ferrimonas marina TaxID=299255 RepID=A0A1M5XQT2_9GAMM|nr:peptidoglycan DD-metalloendopeptidase family protein [Ferrimonas marina]SHI01613.1 Septal ring factor EnvC, activator of murein hydrolases AmiA and AmiB [Ferrimonas marina]